MTCYHLHIIKIKVGSSPVARRVKAPELSLPWVTTVAQVGSLTQEFPPGPKKCQYMKL